MPSIAFKKRMIENSTRIIKIHGQCKYGTQKRYSTWNQIFYTYTTGYWMNPNGDFSKPCEIIASSEATYTQYKNTSKLI